jgi:hypothetical protein
LPVKPGIPACTLAARLPMFNVELFKAISTGRVTLSPATEPTTVIKLSSSRVILRSTGSPVLSILRTEPAPTVKVPASVKPILSSASHSLPVRVTVPVIDVGPSVPSAPSVTVIVAPPRLPTVSRPATDTLPPSMFNVPLERAWAPSVRLPLPGPPLPGPPPFKPAPVA